MFFGALSPQPRGRSVHSRIQVFFKIDAAVLAPRLSEGMRPRHWRGSCLGELRFTRLDAVRALLRPLSGRTDHFSCRFAVDMETPAGLQPASWVLTRKTSSWFEALYGNAMRHSGYERSRFLVTDDAEHFNLLIAAGARGAKPEMRLRADAVVRSSSELFPSGGAVQDYLRSAQRLEPFDPYAPEADADLLTHLTPEPLCLLELEARVFETFPPESIVVDSAWRWVDRRKLVLTETAFERSESAVPAT